MSFEQNLTEMLRDTLSHLGYEIVCIVVQGSNKKVIEVLIEKSNGDSVTISDCVSANREISAILDVENPIRGPYVLQVASPGLDRPLVKKDDYVRFKGQEARIVLYSPINGRKKFIGELQGLVDEQIQLKIKENEIEEVILFSFDDIQKAKLVPKFG